MSPAVPATLHRRPTFSLSFSLRGIQMYNRGLNRDLPPPLPSTPRSLLSLRFAFVSVTTCPCHLIFSHPPHTRPPTKRHQSHHPIPSQIFRSPHISLRIWPSPLTSSYLTSPCLYPLPSSPHSLPAMCFQWSATRLVSPVSFRLGLPMTLVQTHILRPLRPLRHRRTSFAIIYIDNYNHFFPSSTNAVTQFFGAFLSISSAEVSLPLNDLDHLIYRCKKEFLGSHSEIYCTTSTYLPLIDRLRASASHIHFGFPLFIFDWKLQVFKPSSLDSFYQPSNELSVPQQCDRRFLSGSKSIHDHRQLPVRRLLVDFSLQRYSPQSRCYHSHRNTSQDHVFEIMAHQYTLSQT